LEDVEAQKEEGRRRGLAGGRLRIEDGVADEGRWPEACLDLAATVAGNLAAISCSLRMARRC
jgi:hypothetical protein